MKTTARNELHGKITEILSGGVMSEVKVQVSSEITISATVTNEAIASLELKTGDVVTTLIKSSFVMLSTEQLRTTARNNFAVVISDILLGAVNSEVKLVVGEQTLCAIVTNDAVKELKLKVGQTVYAFFKASSVLLVA